MVDKRKLDQVIWDKWSNNKGIIGGNNVSKGSEKPNTPFQRAYL